MIIEHNFTHFFLALENILNTKMVFIEKGNCFNTKRFEQEEKRNNLEQWHENGE